MSAGVQPEPGEEPERRAPARVVLWDVLDTLVRDPFHDAMPGFFGMTLEEMLAAKTPDTWVRFERSEISEEEFLESFFHDRRAFDQAGFRACIQAAYRWMPGIEPLLVELRGRGVEMHVLSNYPAWYRWIEARLAVARYVPWSFVSCDTGVRKPDPEAFVGVARKLGRPAGDFVLVDDRARNCDAARATGMHAIVFDGDVATLRSSLADLDLLARPRGRPSAPGS